MILIFSDSSDETTNDVIDWLLKMDVPFLRLNESDQILISDVMFRDGRLTYTLSFHGKTIRNTDISAVWMRRGGVNLKAGFKFSSKNNTYDTEISQNLILLTNQIVKAEYETFREFIIADIFDRPHVNTLLSSESNKLISLKVANKLKLNIPDSVLIEDKKKLVVFFKKHNGKIISKLISPGISSKIEFTNASTIKVEESMISSMPEKFQLSLFQNMIEKSFEIRCFFLNGYFYSEAIFSQNDEKTMVDFRNYNYEKPNRTCPYILPKNIERKLNNLMKELGFNCGSIDLIYTKNKKYVFLEINPVGQFAQVSYPCNYYLEELIANCLALK